MKLRTIFVSFFLGAVLSAQVVRNSNVALKNWPAPLYWQPSQSESEAGRQAEIRNTSPKATSPAGSLVFVAMTPCRVVDTRASQMFPAQFGPPSLAPGPARSFPIQSSALCSIPSTAQAYSFNVTVVPPEPLGYLIMWPTGQMQPNAVTLDNITRDIRNNAAIVPAGAPNGSVSAVVNANTDLVIDINGYYAPSTGISLAQGTSVAPSLSFAGDPMTGIFSSGAGTLNLTTGGTTGLTLRSDGDLDLVGSIRKAGTLFLHDLGNFNTALGVNALSNANSGGGSANTACGNTALFANTMGSNNTANGTGALSTNTIRGANTAIGESALSSNSLGNGNTAVGTLALSNAIGSFNIALGTSAGANITGNSNNIDIGSNGLATDNGIIRIGSSSQTAFFAAGVRGIITGNNDALTVLIDSNGQLGTQSSSRRFKEDIQDMSDASSGVLRLRPVTFRYQRPYSDGSKPLDYGLIAEEVAEVYPDLVVKGADGQIQSLQYHKLTPMLLNELQKEHQTIQSLRDELSALRQEHAALQTAFESLMAGKIQPTVVH